MELVSLVSVKNLNLLSNNSYSHQSIIHCLTVVGNLAAIRLDDNEGAVWKRLPAYHRADIVTTANKYTNMFMETI